MIDPKNITNFDRTDEELQTFWLFSIAVAGKNSDTAARAVARFLAPKVPSVTPFEYIRDNAVGLHNALVASRIGQYGRITQAYQQSTKLDLRTCSIEDLESIHGVGPKTARFFLLHSRPGIKVAVLDTHILRWMRERFDMHDCPTSTPPKGAKYAAFERLAINLMEASYPGMTIAQADLLIWQMMSGRLDGIGEASV